MRWRHPLLLLVQVLAAITIAAPASSALASDVALYAGAGPRFGDADTSTVGTIRAGFGVAPQLTLAVELQGFIDSPRQAEAWTFAGATTALGFDVPVPGPVTPELGLALSFAKLRPERHGVDETVPLLEAEFGLRLGLGPVRIRAAYNYGFWSSSSSLADRAKSSQLMFQIGVGL